ncbi:dynein assembly factor 4, axonemal [Periophthalmus magnuspinnatus]|uniref:dynein assembly factor 4, axonemal n=1 Tax=Periophthalmus magnuspinnatus TaxID=409849 RepID=UPI002436A330|nr:dynein assembly factor 4, axonemal [Periophthalmus magnuspinnatus]
MPLLITDYSWTQTDSTVYISVPLKGVRASQVDIIATDQYLKVHFPPYLFEAFLAQPVDEDKSTAKVGNGAALLTLSKKTEELWDQLMLTTDGKETKKKLREEALIKHQEKLCAESKAKAEKQQAEKKYALKTMMKLEQEERQNIQKIKDLERQNTTAALEAWQKKQKQQLEKCIETTQKNPTKNTTQGCVSEAKARSDNRGLKSRTQVELPAPRASGSIQVTFTPRVFPTALRESRVAEEEEWLRKQVEARRATSDALKDLKDLKEEERNPDWLKDKGDKCFSTGDYQGAVNAYSLAIRLNRKVPALFSNRAACHLKLKNLHKAIEDSSEALELLTPAVPANAAARARAYVRRGTAFCQLQLYTEGLQEYQAALKIDPENAKLQADTQRIRDIIQGSAKVKT